MKLKNVLEVIGFRGGAKHYKYELNEFSIDNHTVRYAQWQHPRESKKIIAQKDVDVYRHILQEGDFCIDIGAHTGDSTLPMALAVGTKGAVLALEPNPYVYHVLEKNARANRKHTNIYPMMVAASDTEEFISFEYSDSGFCNGGKHQDISVWKHGHAFKLEVFAVNLENELKSNFEDYLERLKFIKIDAEGYDLYILQSLRTIIKEYRPIIKAEVFKKTDTKYRLALLEFFESLNYQVFKVSSEPIAKGEAITDKNIKTWKHYDILCEP